MKNFFVVAFLAFMLHQPAEAQLSAPHQIGGLQFQGADGSQPLNAAIALPLHQATGCLQVSSGVFTFLPVGAAPFFMPCAPMAMAVPTLSITPNPADAFTVIKAVKGFAPNASFVISTKDQWGHIVWLRSSVALSTLQAGLRIELSGLSAGVYYITLQTATNQYTYKLVRAY